MKNNRSKQLARGAFLAVVLGGIVYVLSRLATNSEVSASNLMPISGPTSIESATKGISLLGSLVSLLILLMCKGVGILVNRLEKPTNRSN